MGNNRRNRVIGKTSSENLAFQSSIFSLSVTELVSDSLVGNRLHQLASLAALLFDESLGGAAAVLQLSTQRVYGTNNVVSVLAVVMTQRGESLHHCQVSPAGLVEVLITYVT